MKAVYQRGAFTQGPYSAGLVYWPLSRLRHRILPLDKTNQHHDNRHYEEQVQESADGVRRHKTNKPEHDKNDCDGVKHGYDRFN